MGRPAAWACAVPHTTRYLSSPPPATAATTSNPCGRASSRIPPRHGPPASSTSIRTRPCRTSARSVKAPPWHDALCSTALVVNSRSHQAHVIGQRTPSQPSGQRRPRDPDLARFSGIGPSVSARPRRRGCRRHDASPYGRFMFHSLSRQDYRWERKCPACPVIVGPGPSFPRGCRTRAGPGRLSVHPDLAELIDHGGIAVVEEQSFYCPMPGRSPASKRRPRSSITVFTMRGLSSGFSMSVLVQLRTIRMHSGLARGSSPVN